MNRLLITGANGFLGRAFARTATEQGAQIVALSGRRRTAADELSVDLRDENSLRAVVREVRPTHVFNFASLGVTRDPSTLSELLAVNTIGAMNLLKALDDEGLHTHTFMFGTAYEYQDSAQPLRETDALDPQSPYAISKTTLYYALKQYAGASPVTLLRLFNIFGPGEPADRLIPFIARKARAGEEIPLTGGEQQRDFMFVADLMSIFCQLANLPSPDAGLRSINVGSGRGTSLKSFIGYVADALEQRGLSPMLRLGALPYRTQDPMRCIANNDLLRDLLGEFPFTDLQSAVEQTVQALHEK